MVIVELFTDYVIRILWVVSSIMIGSPSGVNFQIVKYQAHFLNSNWPPELYRRCSHS